MPTIPIGPASHTMWLAFQSGFTLSFARACSLEVIRAKAARVREPPAQWSYKKVLLPGNSNVTLFSGLNLGQADSVRRGVATISTRGKPKASPTSRRASWAVELQKGALPGNSNVTLFGRADSVGRGVLLAKFLLSRSATKQSRAPMSSSVFSLRASHKASPTTDPAPIAFSFT